MPLKTVKLLRDFKEDKRISMDIYADFLSKGINEYFSDEFIFLEIVLLVKININIDIKIMAIGLQILL